MADIPSKGKTERYGINGLDCASCAANIEKALNRKEGLSNAVLNFAAGTITLDPTRIEEAQKIIDNIEPGVLISRDGRGEATQEERKSLILRIGKFAATFLLFIFGMVFRERLHNTPFSLAEYAVFLTAYVLVGWPVLVQALRNIGKRNLFDENFLMTVATVGAIAVHELPEAVGVMLFYFVGESFQDRAVNRSRRSIKELMDIKPDFANLKGKDGLETVAPETLRIGDTIMVKPGEKVPMDGEILTGDSYLDTSALTGESVPRSVGPGDQVLGGTLNTRGLLTITVTRVFADSSVAKILELVENASSRKANTEKFITRFSRYYTPLVVFAAAALAIIPPIVVPGALFSDWVYRALVLLVISCPCALLISIPLGYFGGIGGASRRGILVKGANFLEALTKVDTVVLDKTGTITEGIFRVSQVAPENGFSQRELLEYAAHAESGSAHPIAASILEAYQDPIDHEALNGYEEISGQGVKVNYRGKAVIAGNDRLLHQESIPHDICLTDSTVVYVALNGVLAGSIKISDQIKTDAKEALSRLKRLGIGKIVMLTGDEESVAGRIAGEVGIEEYYATLLPEQKVSKVEDLIHSSEGGKIMFVGDGINDAPVIARADIGVAMGGLGSDAAVEAADIVIMDDKPSKIATAIEIARRTKAIIWQNIILALGVKLVFVALGAVGMATMWEAVFADMGVALLAVFNAARVLRIPSG